MRFELLVFSLTFGIDNLSAQLQDAGRRSCEDVRYCSSSNAGEMFPDPKRCNKYYECIPSGKLQPRTCRKPKEKFDVEECKCTDSPTCSQGSCLCKQILTTGFAPTTRWKTGVTNGVSSRQVNTQSFAITSWFDVTSTEPDQLVSSDLVLVGVGTAIAAVLVLLGASLIMFVLYRNRLNPERKKSNTGGGAEVANNPHADQNRGRTDNASNEYSYVFGHWAKPQETTKVIEQSEYDAVGPGPVKSEQSLDGGGVVYAKVDFDKCNPSNEMDQPSDNTDMILVENDLYEGGD